MPACTVRRRRVVSITTSLRSRRLRIGSFVGYCKGFDLLVMSSVLLVEDANPQFWLD